MKTNFRIYKVSKVIVIILLLVFNTTRAQWEQTNGPLDVERTSSLAVLITNSGDTNLYAGTYEGGIFLSTNNGNEWESLVGENWNTNTGSFTKKDVTALLPIQDSSGNINLFAGTEGDGIFLSVNHDTNWTEINTGLTNTYVSDILLVDTLLFAIADTSSFYVGHAGTIFRSSNLGSSWEVVNNNIADTSVTALTFYKDKLGITNLFAGTWLGGVYQSKNFGENWTRYDNEMNGYYIFDLTMLDTVLLAATNYQVFRSYDKSKTWEQTNNDLINVMRLEVKDSIIFAQSERDIYYSTNSGSNWQNGSGPGYDLNCMKTGGNYLFVGINAPFFVSNSVWRTLLSKIITNVDNDTKLFPSNFTLYQNYPNPFNPSTIIKYQIPQGGLVTLKIYDILGNEIKTLVKEYKGVGRYEVKFNASNLSSGIYIYRISANDFISSKKMLLLK